jgi:uncharacterized protein (TIGR02246 family)
VFLYDNRLVISVTEAVPAPQEAAHEIVKKWATAFANADVDAIATLYAPEALMIGTSGTTVLNTPEQIRHYFEVALNANRPRTATLNSFEALVLDERTVVITGFDTVTGTKDGKQIVGKGRVTFVVARRGSAWSIVHLHRSPLPVT